jgi:hypothetical protein
MTQTPNWLDLIAAYKHEQKSSAPNCNLSEPWIWPKNANRDSRHGWRISKPRVSNSEATPSPGVDASGPNTLGRK